MFEKLSDYGQLIRLDKPIGTLLLLWPTLWGLWIAGEGQPASKNVLIFVTGVFIMRSAGCAINDIADRDIDKHVTRTRQRPLTSGRVSLNEAIVLFLGFCLMALLLVLNLNLKTILLSLVGAFLAACYPFMKRITHLPQVFLGVAFAWGIPMAFAAQTNSLPVICWWLMLANIFWVVAYDTMYAMADKEDDLKIGVKSTAILFGDYDRMMVLTCQLALFGLLIYIGQLLKLNHYYYLLLALSAIFALFQVSLYFSRETQKCFRAFQNNAWFGSFIFIGFVLAYLPT